MLLDGPISMGGHAAGLQVNGFQFGTSAVDRDPFWSRVLTAISVTLDGVPCLSIERATVNGGANGATALTCTVDPLLTTAGTKTMDVTVAGQVAETDPNTALGSGGAARTVTVGCRAGWFGRRGETCAPCPTDGALCNGYLSFLPGDAAHTYPVVQPGW